ncbi:uncharacterized protein LOC116413764 [Galleria mellonella]|uniref:Uncharacterized protein LOC116413764 n=1 Tax=Galleria mellonella TaxID=7137 RepID=A0A6J3CCA0_GALME|nr:uncharacterized protein LOC116413764 [Galleria mellonella]
MFRPLSFTIQLLLIHAILAQVLLPRSEYAPRNTEISISSFKHTPLSSEKINSIVSALRKTPTNTAVMNDKKMYLAEILKQSAIQRLMLAADANNNMLKRIPNSGNDKKIKENNKYVINTANLAAIINSNLRKRLAESKQ